MSNFLNSKESSFSNVEELEEFFSEHFNNFKLITSKTGELIVQLGVMESEDGELISMDSEEEVDEDDFLENNFQEVDVDFADEE